MRYRLRLTALACWLAVVVLAWLSVRFSVTIDVSAGQQHRLAQASRALLDTMPAPIHIDAYLPNEASLRRQVSALLSRYQYLKADFSWRFHDLDSEPETRVQHAIPRTGALFVEYQQRQARVEMFDESTLTRALASLHTPQPRKIAFWQGHGERSITAQGDDDVSQLAKILTQRDYQLTSLPGLQPWPDAPMDALVLASPKVNLLAGEWQQLRHYLDQGGHLLWLTEPNAAALPQLAAYLGIAFSEHTVDTPAPELYGLAKPGFAIINRYGNHPALRGFVGFSLLVNARAITTTPEPPWQSSVLWQTPPPAEQPLAISLTRLIDERLQRVIVAGDGDFLSNAYLNRLDNQRLTLRLFDWLTDRKLPDVTLEQPEVYDMELNLPKPLWLGYVLTFLLMLPTCFLCLSVGLWWRQR
ncbi:MAG: DUF4350 domain-containing protein [Methylococcales bacterium]|nr:DUF4350 domain-containing protein [Methylococcales bacterium]